MYVKRVDERGLLESSGQVPVQGPKSFERRHFAVVRELAGMMQNR